MDEYISREEPGEAHPIGTSNQMSYTKSPGVTNFWVGRNVSRLVAVRGDPELIIDAVPIGASCTGRVATVCYVYFPKAGAVGACNDAYVVDLKSGTIIRYHCR
jgi:hypothetical protein